MTLDSSWILNWGRSSPGQVSLYRHVPAISKCGTLVCCKPIATMSEGWSLSQLPLGRQGTPWTGHQSLVGPTQKQTTTQAHTGFYRQFRINVREKPQYLERTHLWRPEELGFTSIFAGFYLTKNLWLSLDDESGQLQQSCIKQALLVLMSH